ncbi:hypothetical protein [Otoolea muris]|uniref:hypothetical protein n=1 Tax=Otoolea muris TaxID=2941515 RepID=UPI00203B2077|nr:hypothetical protein [Otoolea muris]
MERTPQIPHTFGRKTAWEPPACLGSSVEKARALEEHSIYSRQKGGSMGGASMRHLYGT